MLGLCSTVARVGGMVAPWLAVYLPGQVHHHPPLLPRMLSFHTLLQY